MDGQGMPTYLMP